MKLTKFSLMNPNEVDHIEQLQQTVFRPNSFKQAKETAKKLLVCLKNKTKLGKEEKEMMIRLSNLIKSNAEFNGYTEEQYLTDCLADDAPARRIAIARLMKDTNKGNKGYETQVGFPFTVSSEKFHEALAKRRLMLEFGLADTLFVILPDTGPSALFVDEKKGKISRADDMTYKTNRSVDAITELDNVVIVWCMKYKGGTAAVGGSGQTDQGTTEGAHFSKVFENWHAKGNEIMYKNKPVFFANLVYGGQFNDHKRIVGNEMAFKLDYDCKRSFNISLDRVKDVIDFFNSNECQLDNALEIVYNKYAYDIEYTGKPKTAEKARLLEWTNTNLIIKTV
jgi:hypothetical protein